MRDLAGFRCATIERTAQVAAGTRRVELTGLPANLTAFVSAEAERPDGVWLPGIVQLYRDRHFAGMTQWNPQSSDKFRFSFGRDDRTRVVADRVKDRTGDGGFLGNRAEREIGYTFTLTNLHKSPVDFLILESSPVSTADSIEVQTNFDPKPTAENWENRQGVVAWERSLEPGADLKVNVGYTVSYPKEISVIGLP